MYASELKACGLGAVVAVLLGAGIGVGWHYFGDGARAGASPVALPAKQDAPNLLSSNPHAQPEDPVLDLSRARGMALELSDEQKLALVALLTRSIANDRYPSSPRVRTLRTFSRSSTRSRQRSLPSARRHMLCRKRRGLGRCTRDSQGRGSNS